MIKAILAVDSEFGIGKQNKLAWHHPEDLAYFKSVTSGDAIIMGNNTWKSLPDAVRPMPGRFNIVVASSYDSVLHKDADIVITDSLVVYNFMQTIVPRKYNIQREILAVIDVARNESYVTTWIIGGASIYKLMMGFVEELHMTVVPGTHSCDVCYNPLEGVKPFTLKQQIPLKNKHGNYSLTVGVYGADPF